MTLTEFFKTFDIQGLVDLYIQITDPLAKVEIKQIIKNRLEIEDDDSFELWLRMY